MAGSTKEKFVNFNRNNIIETAERLFSEYGYENVTTDQIKDAAGCSKSTLYNYFRNKDQIFNGIVLKGMQTVAEILEHALDTDFGDGYGSTAEMYEQKFFGMCFGISEFQEKHPLRFEGVAGNIEVNFEGESANLLKQIFDAGEDINETIGKFLSEGIAKGVLRSDLKLPQTIFTFWGALLGVVRIGGQDEKVIQRRMKVSKKQFLKYSFGLLLNSMK